MYLFVLAAVPGCATLTQGSSQTITVSTAPPGASCTLDRVGERVGAIAQTPGSVRLDKSKHDLTVTCSKDGFQTASVTHAPSFSGATFGNLIAGGVIGVIVDASSGANYYYPGDVRLELSALPAVPVAGGTAIGTGAPAVAVAARGGVVQGGTMGGGPAGGGPAGGGPAGGGVVQPVRAEAIVAAPRPADVY